MNKVLENFINFLKKEDYQNALVELENLEVFWKDEIEIQKHVAYSHLLRLFNEVSENIELLKKLCKLSFHIPEIQIKILEKILTCERENPELLNTLADLYTREEDYSKAISIYQKIISNHSSQLNIVESSYFQLYKIYKKLQDYNQAIFYLEKYCEYDKKNKITLLVEEYIFQKKYEKLLELTNQENKVLANFALDWALRIIPKTELSELFNFLLEFSNLNWNEIVFHHYLQELPLEIKAKLYEKTNSREILRYLKTEELEFFLNQFPHLQKDWTYTLISQFDRENNQIKVKEWLEKLSLENLNEDNVYDFVSFYKKYNLFSMLITKAEENYFHSPENKKIIKILLHCYYQEELEEKELTLLEKQKTLEPEKFYGELRLIELYYKQGKKEFALELWDKLPKNYREYSHAGVFDKRHTLFKLIQEFSEDKILYKYFYKNLDLFFPEKDPLIIELDNLTKTQDEKIEYYKILFYEFLLKEGYFKEIKDRNEILSKKISLLKNLLQVEKDNYLYNKLLYMAYRDWLRDSKQASFYLKNLVEIELKQEKHAHVSIYLEECVRNQNIEEAISILEKIQNLHPNFKIQVYLGDLYFEKNPKKALENYNQALEVLTTLPQKENLILSSRVKLKGWYPSQKALAHIYGALGLLYESTQEEEKAIQNYSLALKYEEDPYIIKNLFSLYIQKKDYKNSYHFLEKLLIVRLEKFYPKDDIKQNFIYYLYSDLQQQKEFFDLLFEKFNDLEFKNFITELPSKELFLAFLQKIFDFINNPERKLITLKKLYKTHTEFPNFKYPIYSKNSYPSKFIELYKKTGRKAEGLQFIKELPWEVRKSIAYEISQLYIDEKDLKSFKEFMREYLLREINDKENRADSFSKPYFEICILDPFFKQCKKPGELNFFQELLLELTQKLENKDKLSVLYDFLGEIHFERQEFSQALNYYKKSYEIQPEWHILQEIAEVYLKQNKLKKAKEYFRETLKMIPKRFAYEFFCQLEYKEYWISFAKEDRVFREILLENLLYSRDPIIFFGDDRIIHPKLELYPILLKNSDSENQLLYMLDLAESYIQNKDLLNARTLIEQIKAEIKFCSSFVLPVIPFESSLSWSIHQLSTAVVYPNLTDKDKFLLVLDGLEKNLKNLEEEAREKEKLKLENQTKKNILSYILHSFRNSFSTGSLIIQEILELTQKALAKDYENSLSYEIFNNLSGLYSNFELAENVLNNLQLFLQEDENFFKEWKEDQEGNESVNYLFSLCLKQNLTRFLFSEIFISQRKSLISNYSKEKLKTLRKSFLENILSKNFDELPSELVLNWVKENFPFLKLEISDEITRFHKNKVRFILIYNILSEAIFNSLKYSSSQKPIEISWKRENKKIFFECKNFFSTESAISSSSKTGLQFVENLVKKISTQVKIDYKKEKKENKFVVKLELEEEK